MMVDVHFPPDVAHGGGVPWNGFLLTQWLRRFDNARNTPVILISASDRAEYKKKASAVGATAFLPKPIDNETLLSSLDTALFNKSDSAPAPVAQPETDAQAQKTEPSTPVAAASAAAENAEKPTVEFGL
jgi:DNA-binding response OmpR family regulator